MTLIVKPGFNGMTDTDAIAYVNAVEAADGQLLEFGVGKAINDFVVGCKLDGTWSAIKASCILAGARTLTGALVPLAGTAPTNVNFVSGDYNRKTGLVGDGTSKYLNSNRNSNADPQDNAHTSIYVSVARTNSSVYIGCDPAERSSIYALDGNNIGFSLRQASPSYSSAALTTTGFIGQSRSISTSIQGRVASTGTTFSVSSTGFGSGNYLVFARLNSGVLASVTNARLAFYSIGESLDLALLDARVTALITAFGVAIP